MEKKVNVSVNKACDKRNVASVGARQVEGIKNLTPKKPQKQVDTSTHHININPRAGRISSSKANGAMALRSSAVRQIQYQSVEQLMHRTGIFEFFWYPIFIVLGVLCLVLVPIFTNPSTTDIILLIASVLTLWLGMTGNNLVAKGYRLGLLLCTVNMVIYVGICIYQKVWGDAIINVLVYIPLEILGFFKWKKNQELAQLKGASGEDVQKMDGKTLLIHISLLIGISVVVWAFLNFGLKQAFAIFNAVSIAGCVVGDLARNKRYFETWYFFMICNIAGIALWGLQVFASDTVTLAILPTAISCVATLSNNFNGVYIWNVIYTKNHLNGGVYLAERKVNIKKIAKIKRVYKKMTCRETQRVVALPQDQN